jgi:glucosylceramidase
MMNPILKVILLSAGLTSGLDGIAQKENNVSVWLSDPSGSILFQQQPGLPLGPGGGGSSAAADPVIRVDEHRTFQPIDGFGWALTDGSAQHIIRMSPASRAALLRDLFTTGGTHIGGSYLRLTIGASDLSDHVYSYDDLPEGQTDTAMEHFDLGPNKKDVIPVLQEILKIDPSIKILGSPWSAPTWMKTNHDTRGGSLLPEFYPAYAKYLVKYIKAMQREGIRIDAITIQNEPLHPGNNPSMYMPAGEEGAFIKTALGPAFRQAKLRTKIIIYDHNADRPDYPDSILNDPEAAKYVDGSAFHLYGGTIDTLSWLHNKHPDKNLYFTEQWVGAPGNFRHNIREHIDRLIIGATRNWCRNVIEWNLAADPSNNPHTDRGGCDRCQGAVTIDKDSVKRNPAYYIIAHAAKFVRPGSVRVATNSDELLPNVAFRTLQGKTVLIVLNNTDTQRAFTIESKGRWAMATLNAGAVATYVW